MARDRQRPGRRRILDAAGRLFYEQGVHSVGVDSVIEAAGVAKMTLYRNFASKAELVAAYLAERDVRWRTEFEARLAGAGVEPVARVGMVFDVLGEWFDSPDFHGCAFIRASAENTDEVVQAAIVRHKQWFREFLRGLLLDADVAEPDLVAEQLFVLVEGAMVIAAMEGRSVVADHARQAAERLVADARVATSRVTVLSQE
ncbi:TetR/AcrR family transcriptional regulator [Salinactinospora qingdaonensis]|uniref:TetR/AcrR family transcriptional regulator n=1 Tax=Salinactinospora qingdaonensis TaxID=702744 RepID=A0ABP7FKQ9_9ACTN